MVVEAFRAVRVPRRRSGSEESEAVRERLSEANSGAWRRMASFWLSEFLGFPRGRPRSTSVGSVSTGEGLMCTDLIGRDGLLGLEDLDTVVSHGGCEILWSLDLADKYV